MNFRPILTLTAWLLAAPAWAGAVEDARALLDQRQPDQALVRLESHLATQPRDPRARFLKGLALTSLARRDEAIALFRQLTLDFPELSEPYNNLAVLQAQAGRYEEARQALEMALRIQPRNAMAFENLGEVHLRLAAQAFERAGELDPANASARRKARLVQDLATGGASRPPRP